jgi:hypothetical protein
MSRTNDIMAAMFKRNANDVAAQVQFLAGVVVVLSDNVHALTAKVDALEKQK